MSRQFAFFVDGANPEIKRSTTVKDKLTDRDHRIEPEQDEGEGVQGMADEGVGAFCGELGSWHCSLRTTQMPNGLSDAKEVPNVGDPQGVNKADNADELHDLGDEQIRPLPRPQHILRQQNGHQQVDGDERDQ